MDRRGTPAADPDRHRYSGRAAPGEHDQLRRARRPRAVRGRPRRSAERRHHPELASAVGRGRGGDHPAVNGLVRVRRSIRLKILLVVLATTFIALLFTGTILVIYDLASQRNNAADDLIAQAEIIGLASAPALDFNDSLAANQNLAVLRVRPQIVAAALYNRQGRLFATYARDPLANVRFA